MATQPRFGPNAPRPTPSLTLVGTPGSRVPPNRPLPVPPTPKVAGGPTTFQPATTPPSRLATTNPTDVLAQRYQRPRSMLDFIFRTLRVTENVSAGFTKGLTGGGDIVAPWTWLSAFGEGFSEIPQAVQDDLTFGQWIQQSADPNSFWYRHASVVGLGMSIFFDPTTYLSFGATSSSKIAAKGLLSTQAKLSAEEASRLIAKGGKLPISGVKAGPGTDFDVVFAEVHRAHGRAWTMGDAMLQLRQADRGRVLGRLSSGQIPRPGDVFRTIAPRGGRGVRFAGAEIPGTPSLGRAIGQKGRGVAVAAHTTERTEPGAVGKLSEAFDTGQQFAESVTRGVGKAFIPDAKMKAISNDLIRSLALAEFRDIDNEVSATFEKIAKATAPNIAKLDAAPNTASKSVWYTFGSPVGYIPQAARRDALREGADLTKHAQLPKMVRLANLRKGDIIRGAKHAGFDDRQVQDLHNLWDTLVQKYHDPVQIVAEFMYRGGSRIAAAKHIERIISNPLFARRIDEDIVGKAGVRVGEIEDFEKVAGQGALPFKYKGKTYAVIEPIHHALMDMRNPKYIDYELSRFFRAANWAQNKWKIPATVLNPSFHIMNLVGGMWNNMLGGVYNPMDYIDALGTIYKSRAAEGTEKAGRFAPVRAFTRAVSSEEGRKASRETIEAFERKGAGGRSTFFSAEISKGAAREVATVGKRPLPRRAFTAARRGFLAASTAELVANQWLEDDIDIPGANPLLGLLAGAPEAARLGRSTASMVEEVLRLTPFQVAAKDRSFQQILEAVGPITPPNFVKVAPRGITKRQKDAMWNIGAEMAIHYQFDYSNLTTFERYVAKSIFPFYTFHKNNFVLQAKELVQRPRVLNVVESTTRFLEEEANEQNPIDPNFRELLPEYFSKLAAFQVPVPSFMRKKLGLPEDAPLFLNPKLPYTSLNLVPPLWEVFNDDSFTPGPTRWLQVFSTGFGMVGPFAGFGMKTAIEYMLGTSLGLARPIDFQRAQSNDWRDSVVDAPSYAQYVPGFMRDVFGIVEDDQGRLRMTATQKYVLDVMASPFISNFGNTIPVYGDEATVGKAKADTVAWMTGIRLMPVDPLKVERSWAYRARSAIQSKKSQVEQQGGELSFEDNQFYKFMNRQVKVLERAWDARQQELYGPGY